MCVHPHTLRSKNKNDEVSRSKGGKCGNNAANLANPRVCTTLAGQEERALATTIGYHKLGPIQRGGRRSYLVILYISNIIKDPNRRDPNNLRPKSYTLFSAKKDADHPHFSVWWWLSRLIPDARTNRPLHVPHPQSSATKPPPEKMESE